MDVCHHHNVGVSKARNFAANLGRGDYIVFVDADDVASPNLIDRFSQRLMSLETIVLPAT